MIKAAQPWDWLTLVLADLAAWWWTAGGGRWQVGSGKWEVRSGKWEVGSGRCRVRLVPLVRVGVDLLVPRGVERRREKRCAEVCRRPAADGRGSMGAERGGVSQDHSPNSICGLLGMQ
ncbi:hypothetical protein F5Y14DRAFT_233019 [Nemania sp. NC0429]|nr:hypothetical protein F5Y14DRAFT_233019 [Nemania sp. NC0429]